MKTTKSSLLTSNTMYAFALLAVISLQLNATSKQIFDPVYTPFQGLSDSSDQSYLSDYDGIKQSQDIPYYKDFVLPRPNELFTSSEYLSDAQMYQDHKSILFKDDYFLDYIKGTPITEITPYYIEKIERVLYCRSHDVKISMKLDIRKAQDFEYSSPFVIVFPAHEATQMTGLKVTNLNISETYSSQTFKDLQIKDYKDIKKSPLPSIFAIPLDYLTTNDDVTILIEFHLGRPYTPYPLYQRISDVQTLELPFYSKVLTPYDVKSEVTLIHLDRQMKISKIKHPDNLTHLLDNREKNYVKLGPYANTPSYNLGLPVKIILENASPLPIFPKASKTFHISALNRIYINEDYLLVNEAAEIKDAFERKDVIDKLHQFRGMRINAKPSSMLTFLNSYQHSSMENFQYFDVNGNISTSNVFIEMSTNNFKIETIPRFPLVGGWKFAFKIFSKFPLNPFRNYKTALDRQFISLPFSPSISEVYIDKYTIDIKLPYGVSDIQFTSPIEPYSDEIYYYWDWLQPILPSPHLRLIFYKTMIPKEDQFEENITITYKSSGLLSVFTKMFSVIFLLLAPLLVGFFLTRNSTGIIHKAGLKEKKKKKDLKTFEHNFLFILEEIMNSYGYLISYLVSKKSTTFISSYWEKEKKKYLNIVENLQQTLSEIPIEQSSLKDDVSDVMDTLFKLAPFEANITNESPLNSNEKSTLDAKLLELDKKISKIFMT